MSVEKRWLDQELDPALAELLESAAVDEPSPKTLDGLRGKVAHLFLIPPGGGGGDNGGGDAGGGDTGGHDVGGGGDVGVDPSSHLGGLDLGQASAVTAATAGTKVAGLATAGAAAGGLASKTVITVAVATLSVGGAVGVGVSARYKKERPVAVIAAPRPAVPVTPPPPPEATLEHEPDVSEETPEEPAAERSAPPPPPRAPTRRAAAAPDDEVGLLQEALGAASPADALFAAEQHRKQYPESPLAQEREVIAVEALVKLGQRNAALARIQLFRAKWPTSTHLVRLERLVQTP